MRLAGSILLAAGLALFETAGGAAGGEQPTYMMFRCIKTTAGKSGAYQEYMLATTAKAMQVRANEGDVHGWLFAKAVIPSGSEAECDFIQTNFHRGFPPPSTSIDPFFAKAGLKVTRQEWYATLGPMSKLVRLEQWRGVEGLGQLQKGQFIRFDYLKVTPGRADEWKRAQADWLAAARTASEQKLITAWHADEILLPGGSGYRHTARRVIAFPDWSAMGQVPDDQALVRRMLKARAPAVLARETRASQLVSSELYEVVEVIRPAREAAVSAPAPLGLAPAPKAP